MKAHDDLTFNVIGATMAHDDLTFNVIGATIESPSQTPLLAYINQEFAAIKWNCLDGTPVAADCLLLAEGLGWRTAGSLFLGTPQLFSLPLFFCGAPPAETTSSYQSTIVY